VKTSIAVDVVSARARNQESLSARDEAMGVRRGKLIEEAQYDRPALVDDLIRQRDLEDTGLTALRARSPFEIGSR
jgi:hypothetical protein